MPSTSHERWTTSRRVSLDEIEQAHVAVGGTKRGRRYATQQINRAYSMLLASQFQGFCRDLHSECIDHLVAMVNPTSVKEIMRDELNRNRQLDRGNAQSGTIGADFGRLRIDFWTEVRGHDQRNKARQSLLDDLNVWRNAIAHQNFDPTKLGGTSILRLSQVRQFRTACDRLASAFDDIIRHHLHTLTGASPW
ncbi:MAG: Uncharacterized protein JWN86_129 [Planctomycetota bacterium]|nr:Uncharacterized protein [Planctomycetota bacterium]